jgi:prepilin-type N-terminal cleavage/methylation domain-containing protein
MKTWQKTNRIAAGARGFTLIEMIGVLAVIAILAALLIPKVFNAINEARINNAAVNRSTVKTAVVDHFGKYGRFDMIWGTNQLTAPVLGYDTNVLMVEQLLDKPFAAKIAGGDASTNCVIQLVVGSAANGGSGYFLDGSTNNATANAQYVCEAVLYNVAQADAKDLNDRVDGATLGVPLGSADAKGRIEWAAPGSAQAPIAAMYVYLTHR